MKRCPFCAEEIQDAAIVCRFCRADLVKREMPGQAVVITEPARAWSPGIAAVLSLVIPGAGQMYKGHVGAGLAWLLGVVLGYIALIVPGLVLHLICIANAASGDPTTDRPAEPVQQPQAPIEIWTPPPAQSGPRTAAEDLILGLPSWIVALLAVGGLFVVVAVVMSALEA